MKFYSIVFFLALGVHLFGQQEDLISFENGVDLFLMENVVDGFVDYSKVKNEVASLNSLVEKIEQMHLSDFSDEQLQSFYINAYNILVIKKIIDQYPVTSVQEISGFFNRTKSLVGGEYLTFDNIEKDILLKRFEDSRFHFALVCGAKDCPKIWNRAYRFDKLEEQLVAQSQRALNDTDFLRIDDGKIGLSEIFKWNRFEFGSRRDILAFINEYRTKILDPESSTFYYTYDWTLNDTRFAGNGQSRTGNNSFRYVTSAAIRKGGIEIKLFNNLYSQVQSPPSSDESRSTYLTTSLSFLYGTSNRFNIGFAARYRRVHNTGPNTSPIDIFDALGSPNGRQGITAFGPQIRWAPVSKWSNFSVQSSLTLPIGESLSGSTEFPFLDWAGPVFLTQFFNDKSIGDKFSLFTEVDLLIEEIGGSGKSNRVSIPFTGIFSWFPKKNVTIYGLVGYSPYLVKPYDYFRQFGLGAKYQIHPNFEIEILLSDFSNKYLNNNFGQAATYNIGFRYSR